tara:strand:+ start:388 stop:576 length:189 start_codon:yes stop_codon:yes gene_type:complete
LALLFLLPGKDCKVQVDEEEKKKREGVRDEEINLKKKNKTKRKNKASELTRPTTQGHQIYQI